MAVHENRAKWQQLRWIIQMSCQIGSVFKGLWRKLETFSIKRQRRWIVAFIKLQLYYLLRARSRLNDDKIHRNEAEEEDSRGKLNLDAFVGGNNSFRPFFMRTPKIQSIELWLCLTMFRFWFFFLLSSWQKSCRAKNPQCEVQYWFYRTARKRREPDFFWINSLNFKV